ncbi:hypothetical protein [Gynurincola endophyticus]|uniref:hypothetical protein n=1 Tax=Gynurincola endophyticus TaxID=2479004 RepID=UPI000F8DCA1E|nr:hypothetical protein [Gynurincola endophyticus]
MTRLLPFSFLTALLFHFQVSAQNPFLEYAMINSCGTEGANEFVVINTGSTAINVQRLSFAYSQTSMGTGDPIVDGRTSNIWVPAPTGAGVLTGGCTLIPVTSGTVPANSRILIIPSQFTSSYNISSLCSGGNLYVLYFNTSLAFSWTIAVAGNFANSIAGGGSANRFMRVTYYDATNTAISVQERQYAPNSLSSYLGSGDGAGVRWPAAGPVRYLNTGCTNAVLPLQVLSFSGRLLDGYATFDAMLAENETHYQTVLEKSDNGIDFYQAQLIEVQPSQNVTKLQFTDPEKVDTRRMYRIKLQDDNKTIYSTILILQPEKQKNELTLYSNGGNIVAGFYTEQRQMVTVRAVNTSGNVLWTKQQQVEKGLNNFTLGWKNTTAQVVIVQVIGQDFLLSKQILVR